MYWRILLPALLSGLAGLLAQIAWQDAWLALAAAAAGAMAGALPWLGEPRSELSTPERAPEKPDITPTSILEPMLDALPYGVLIVGPDRTITQANLPVGEMFGLQQVRGLPVATLRARRLLDRIETAFAEDRASTLELSLTRMGDAYLRAHISPFGPASNRQVLIAIHDETQERRAQEVHRDFVANASHELKTPLAAVSGVIETLLGAARQDPRATERFLGILSEQTGRMTRLIEDLLSLNRIELNARVMPDEPQDVGRILAEVIDALGTIADQAEVTLVFTPLEAETTVLADRDEIGQLFSNLVDNAIKYGGTGARVEVTSHLGTGDEAGMLGISVEDNGPGIPREDLPRLTERFYRVNIKRSREKGGTGLGLAICKHIVTRHRGRLEIESKLDVGTRFTVWLPLVSGPETRPTAEDGGFAEAKESQAFSTA